MRRHNAYIRPRFAAYSSSKALVSPLAARVTSSAASLRFKAMLPSRIACIAIPEKSFRVSRT